jgi:hypothetical protein
LIFIFPLLAIPILLLLYLSFVAVRHNVEYVNVNRDGGYTGALIGLWTIRRFGWVLGVQPFLFGLVLLSRNEWIIGGIGLGMGVLAGGLSEIFTIGLHPTKSVRDLQDEESRRYFHDPTEGMRGLVYPYEMLAGEPVVWLPHDEVCVAEGEAADLGRYHGLSAIVDPVLESGKNQRREGAGSSSPCRA